MLYNMIRELMELVLTDFLIDITDFLTDDLCNDPFVKAEKKFAPKTAQYRPLLGTGYTIADVCLLHE